MLWTSRALMIRSWAKNMCIEYDNTQDVMDFQSPYDSVMSEEHVHRVRQYTRCYGLPEPLWFGHEWRTSLIAPCFFFICFLHILRSDDTSCMVLRIVGAYRHQTAKSNIPEDISLHRHVRDSHKFHEIQLISCRQNAEQYRNPLHIC
jgi:hypothetical protein